jgi:hypothetical protein
VDELLVEAHGGLPTWNRLDKVEATIVSGGGFFRIDTAAISAVGWLGSAKPTHPEQPAKPDRME